MVARRTPIWFFLTVVLVLFAIGGSVNARSNTAEPPAPQSPEAVAVTPLLQYQGRLTNPATGQPVSDATYAMTFRLYDALTVGTLQWEETKNVAVAGGLFSTALGDSTPLPQSLFSGQSLWLGIKVGSDLEATPRQAVLPVAYALSLVPGASITGSLTSPALRVSNSAGPALVTSGTSTLGGNVTINGTLSGGTHAHSGADITSGTVVDARIDPLIARDAEVAASYYDKTTADTRYVNTAGPDAMSGNSTSPILGVTQNGSGTGVFGYSVGGTGVYGSSPSSYGVRGDAGGVEPGVYGSNSGTGSGVYGDSANATGVYGYSANAIGVRGDAPNSAGVYGTSDIGWGVFGFGPNAYGVYGYSRDGYGVYGVTYTQTKYAGYFYNGGGSGNDRGGGVAGFSGSGDSSYTHPGDSWWKAGGEFSGPNGMIGAASENSGIGVLALSSADGTALYASKSSGSGNALQVSNSGTGSAASISNDSASTTDALQLWNYGTGRAAYFYNSSTGTGDAFSLVNYGTSYAMNVSNNGTGGAAYFSNSSANNGDAFVFSNSGNGDALNVYNNGTGRAGYFSGNVHVNGTFSKAGGSFKIDHPLDPANKYLEHSFVESPDMMNVYNGNITTDANGDATVILPDYFEALNRDFRYQLTVIGQFAQAIVKDEVKDNRFTIKTDKPSVKVSWQVTGIRQDAWANANRIPVEENKPANERGTYLYPEGYSQPASKGLDYARNPGKPSDTAQRVPQMQTVPMTQTLPRPVTPPVSGPATLP